MRASVPHTFELNIITNVQNQISIWMCDAHEAFNFFPTCSNSIQIISIFLRFCIHISLWLASVVARRICNQAFDLNWTRHDKMQNVRIQFFFSMLLLFCHFCMCVCVCFCSSFLFCRLHLHRCVNILCIYALNLHNLRRDMARHDQVYFRVFRMNEIMINRHFFFRWIKFILLFILS